MPESGITFTEETFIVIRLDNEIVMIEKVNGHTERYSCKKATLQDVKQVYGLDKVRP